MLPHQSMSIIFLWTFDVKVLEQWFSARGQFCFQDIFGVVGGHFLLSQLSDVGVNRGAVGI